MAQFTWYTGFSCWNVLRFDCLVFFLCFFFVSIRFLLGKFNTWLLLCVHTSESQSNDICIMFLLTSYLSRSLFSQIAFGCIFWSCVGHTMNIYFHWKERFWLTLSRQKSHNCWFIQFAPTYRLKNIWLLNHKWMNQITTITMHINFVQISTFSCRYCLVDYFFFCSHALRFQLAVAQISMYVFWCICTCFGLAVLVSLFKTLVTYTHNLLFAPI